MINRLATMKVAIVTLILIKCIVAALMPFGGDFVNWVLLGRSMQTEHTFPGIYTGPSFIFAAAFDVWLAATHNSQVADQLYQAYTIGPNLGPPSSTVFAFAFVMKTPLLVADALTLYFIMQVVKRSTSSKERALTAGLLWASSPLVLLLEMGTTVEIYPAFLIMAGSYAIYLSKIKIGSALLALGSVLRLAPLLFSWVYVLALARSRRYRALAEFLAVQFAFFGFGATYVVFRYGTNALFQLFAEYPGILVEEGLTFLGPSLSPGIGLLSYGLDPYSLGLAPTFALLVAYIVTKPTVWRNRTLGVEVVALLGTYFALVRFYIQFFLWIVPTLVVFAATTKFGSRRFILVTALGMLTAFIRVASPKGTANGRAVFMVPNLNETMLYVSSILTAIVWDPVIVALARSLFGASLVLMVFWVIRDSMKPSPPNFTTTETLSEGDTQKRTPTLQAN